MVNAVMFLLEHGLEIIQKIQRKQTLTGGAKLESLLLTIECF